MRYLFLAPFVFLAFACSSESKKTSENTAPVQNAETDTSLVFGDDGQVLQNSTTSKKEIVSETAQLNDKPTTYWALNEAIRNQNEDAIIKESSRILVQNPKDLKALNAQAMASYKKGRFNLAQYLLKRALQSSPNSFETHSNLGVVSLAKGEKREALQYFRKAIQLNPEDPVSSANIGSIYVQERDYGKAAVVLETAYRKGFRDPKVLNNYAIALAAKGNYSKANDLYDEVLRVQPSNKEALFNSAVLLIEHLQKYAEGLDRIQKLKFTGGPADSKSKIAALENKAKANNK